MVAEKTTPAFRVGDLLVLGSDRHGAYGDSYELKDIKTMVLIAGVKPSKTIIGFLIKERQFYDCYVVYNALNLNKRITLSEEYLKKFAKPAREIIL